MLLDKADIIRENRKTVKITIKPDGRLVITCPKTLSCNKLNEIISSKEKLLLKKINNANKIKNENRDIIDLKKILLLGKEFFVVVTEKVGKCYFADDTFLLPKKYSLDSVKQKNFIKKTLKNIANKVLENRVKDILNSYKNKPRQIVIGNFKSKWGSCDSKGVVKLNWKVIMLKPKLVDFIIYH